MLQEGVWSYGCMDNWEKSDETSLTKKEEFYSHLDTEDIINADYPNAKQVWKVLK